MSDAATPTAYPIGDVPGLTVAQVLTIAQAGYRTAADLHRAAFARCKGNRMADSRKTASALVGILLDVFRGDVEQASHAARAVRAETNRRLALLSAGD